MTTSSGGSTWPSVSSAVTGLNVPAPTASVRSAISTPRARIDDRISLGEVESRGRRRDRERLAREDGLVRGAVLGTVERPGLAPDVGRQGSASDPVEEGVVERAVEGHGASPVLCDVDDLGAQVLVEEDPPALPGAASRLGEREPAGAVRVLLSEEKDLDEPPRGVAAVEPRRPNAHVVANEEVSVAQEIRKLREAPVPDLAGRAIERHQAARSARPRLLRDPLRRKLVVEEIDAHGRKGSAGGASPEVTVRPGAREARCAGPIASVWRKGTYGDLARLVRALRLGWVGESAMTRSGSWSLKVALALAVATLIWAGAASVAVSALEGRLHGEAANRPAAQKLLTAR